MKKTLIQNGTLVTAAETRLADLLIVDEQIAQIGLNLPEADAQVVDASGKFILPGAVDVHTHLDLPMAGTRSSDDFYTGHKAAAFGGTTCHLDFAVQTKGESLLQALAGWQQKAEARAVLDYGGHMTVTDVNAATLAELPALARAGVTSLKLMMAYKGRLQVDDAALFGVLRCAAQADMLSLVHAENGDVIELLIAEALAARRLTPEWHARTRPAWLEGEATLRACALAGVAEAPLYVVHVTCGLAVDQLAYARARGLRVMGETCPQYLFFTAADLCRPDGAKWVCSPPVRTLADQAVLWAALRQNTLQVVATDHCPFFFDGASPIEYEGQPVQIPGKELGRDNFTLIPNGVPGLGDRMPVLWTHAVGEGRLTLNQLVQVCCEQPARIFGLYPRKGALVVGADADVVLWNPWHRGELGVHASHQRTDYNLYEGWDACGWPEQVYRRGELLVDGERWLGRPGTGRYLPRGSGQVL